MGRQSSVEYQASDIWSTQNSHADQHRKRNKAICIFLGIALGVSVASQVVDLSLPVYWIVVGFVSFVAAGLFLSCLLLQKVVLPNLGKYAPKTRLLWTSICLLSGFFLVLTIPLMIYPKPQVIEIIATGEKNAEAKGSEVWLNSIVSGGWAAPAHTTTCKGHWDLIDDALVSTGESQPSKLVCTIGTDQDIYIRFGMHDWSGKVRLAFEDQNVKEDLFSTQAGDGKQIVLDVSTSRLDRIIWLVLFIADGVTIGFILLAFLLWAANRPILPAKAEQVKLVQWYWFALALFASWMLYLLVFWPGFFSPDTAVQYDQIVTQQYTNWHPAIHTMILGLTTRLWFAPTPAIILQIILLSGLMGWGLYLIVCRGVPRNIAWSIAAFLAISPAIGLILLNPWKDVAYGISLVAMILMIFFLIENQNKKIGFGFWLLFLIVSAGVALFRLNGVPVAIGTLLILTGLDRRRWKSYLIVSVLTLCIWKGVTGPFYTAMNVNKYSESEGQNIGVYAVGVYLLNSHAISGTPLLPKEREFLSQVIPEKDTLDIAALSQNTRTVLPMAISTSLRNPRVTIDFILMRSSYIFQILQPPRKRIGHVELAVYPNPYGVVADSKIPILQLPFKKVIEFTELPEVDWLFWRNAFWMYLLVAAGAIVCVRMKTLKYLTLIAPVLLNAIPLAAIIGSQISRYVFITLLMGPLLGIGLFFIRPVLFDQDQSEKAG